MAIREKVHLVFSNAQLLRSDSYIYIILCKFGGECSLPFLVSTVPLKINTTTIETHASLASFQ